MSAPTSLAGFANPIAQAFEGEGVELRPMPQATEPGELGAATRQNCIGCRLSFRWLGASRAVYGANLRVAADAFGASPTALRLSKKLLDARHPAVRQLTALRGEAREVWVRSTLPYVEPGVRLLRRDRVGEMAATFAATHGQVCEAADVLQAQRGRLLSEAEERLGSLFSVGDYPETFANAFGLDVTFPNVEPPDYLMGINPELYRREQERVRASFESAVANAQAEFTEELAQLVGHLRDRLSGATPDGRPHVFRDSAIGNIREFIGRVRSISIETDGALAALLAETEGLLDGVSPNSLRADETLRERVATQLAGIEESITVAMPARRITRLVPAEGE